MLGFLLRIAVLGSAIVVAGNFIAMWVRVLAGPRKAPELPASVPPSPARDMVEEAMKSLNAIQVDVARLKDAQMWRATMQFCDAVGRLNEAVLSDPGRYRQARRYLGQILPAAEEATAKFARLFKAGGKEAARAPFLELAGELTSAYDQAAADYLKATEAEVLVEADVLRELLERARRD